MPMGQNLTNPGLEALQALLYRLITAPEGVAAGLAAESASEPEMLEHLIESDDRLSATERLEIYANAYFYRILDCLKEDFPATLATLGPDDFHNLITAYLIEYPPTEPSISYAGRHLAEFLRHHSMRAMIERWPFIAELARLERTQIEVFSRLMTGRRSRCERIRRWRSSIASGAWTSYCVKSKPPVAKTIDRWERLRMLRSACWCGGKTPGSITARWSARSARRSKSRAPGQVSQRYARRLSRHPAKTTKSG